MTDFITRGIFNEEEYNVLGGCYIEEKPKNYEVHVRFGVFRDTKEGKGYDGQILTARRMDKSNKREKPISVFDLLNMVMIEDFSENELDKENPDYSKFFIQTALNYAHQEVERQYKISEKSLKPETLYGYKGLVSYTKPEILDFGINHKTNKKIGDIYTYLSIDKR